MVNDYGQLDSQTDSGIELLIVDSEMLNGDARIFLKKQKDKFRTLWVSNLNDRERSISLLNDGLVSNVCFSSDIDTLITSISKELHDLKEQKVSLARDNQNAIISDAALNTKMAVLITDANGITVWTNKAHTQLTGYILDDMIGKKPGEVLQGPETNQETIEFFSSQLRHQEPFSLEILNYHKNGEKVWLEINVSPIFKNGKIDKFIAFQHDITEKKQNESRLKESLERLTDAQRIGKMCNWVLDPHNFDISWSGDAAQIFGLNDISEFNYFKLRQVLSEKSLKKLNAALFNIRKKSLEFDLVLDYKTSENSERFLRCIGVPVLKDGSIQKIVGIVQDITEQYKAEELALKSQQHLASVTDNMQAGVARIVDKKDGSRDILFANKGFYDLYEVPEDIAEEHFELIYNQTHPEDSVLDIQDILKEVQRTGTAYNQYFRIINPSGKLKWIHLISNATAGIDGDIVHDFIVTDISEKIKKDRLLEEISQVSRNGGWEFDLINSELKWSSVTKQIHEVPDDYEPIVETAIEFYKEGSSRDKIQDLFSKLILDGEPYDTRLEIVTALGNQKWVRAKGNCEYAGEQMVRVFGIFQDITEQVEQEEKILKSLNEKNALLGEIHHRVKNNLAVISGLLQLQLMKGEKEYSLEDAVNRIQSIATVHEILYNTDSFSVVEIADYLERLIQSISKTYPDLNTRIQINSSIDEVDLSINQAVPIGLLLNELITNSMKHALIILKMGLLIYQSRVMKINSSELNIKIVVTDLIKKH